MSHIVIAKTATSSHYRTFTICEIRDTNQKSHQIKLKYSLIHGTCNSKTYHQNYSKKCIKFRSQHFSNFLQKSQFRSKLSIFDWDFSLFSSNFLEIFSKFYFFKDFRLFKTDSNLKKSLEADLVDLRSTVTQLI